MHSQASMASPFVSQGIQATRDTPGEPSLSIVNSCALFSGAQKALWGGYVHVHVYVHVHGGVVFRQTPSSAQTLLLHL
jgi:hypothetical protein